MKKAEALSMQKTYSNTINISAYWNIWWECCQKIKRRSNIMKFWRRNWAGSKNSSPFSHQASSPLFSMSFLKPLPTITKRVHITEMPEHKDPLLILSTYIDEAREEYRHRNVNRIQKEIGVPGFKISSFLSTSQDNVQEVGAKDKEEGRSWGFCNE